MAASAPSQAAGFVHVALVSTARAAREGLCILLERDSALVVDYQSDASTDSIVSLGMRSLDVVLLDGASQRCLAALSEIRARLPQTPIVVYDVQPLSEVLLMCARSSITVAVGQDADGETIASLVKDAASGCLRGEARLNAALLEELAALDHGPPEGVATGLTRREQQIAVALAEGLTNKEIAQRFYISLPTVKSHVHCILRKLKVDRRDQVFARLRGARRLRTPE
jgi:DNA-binding NarL/FixJ family response regulator